MWLFTRNADGTLNAKEVLRDSDGKLFAEDVDNRFGAPVLVDWNGDGLLDILVGLSNDLFDLNTGFDAPGPVLVYINEGTAQTPLFVNKGRLKTEYGADILHEYQRNGAADIDGDGLIDFVASNGYLGPDYGIYYYKNIGTATNPVLAQKQSLVGPVGGYVLFGLADWDYNGTTDIIYTTDSYGGMLNIGISDIPSAQTQTMKPTQTKDLFTRTATAHGVQLQFLQASSYSVALFTPNGRRLIQKQIQTETNTSVTLKTSGASGILLLKVTDLNSGESVFQTIQASKRK